jgi:hypothetical protein
MYKYVNKNLEPLLDVIDEIANTTEGSELLKKPQIKKQESIEENTGNQGLEIVSSALLIDDRNFLG